MIEGLLNRIDEMDLGIESGWCGYKVSVQLKVLMFEIQDRSWFGRFSFLWLNDQGLVL